MNAPFDRDDEEWSKNWLQTELGADARSFSQINLFLEKLIGENEKQNLIAKGTVPYAWSRHIVDSAQLLRHVSRETPDWLDLGTGAGFPGLVCAMLNPETRFTLVEQRPLRTTWLQTVCDSLSLNNVDILTTNIAQVPTPEKKFAVITARAFAPLPRLLKLSAAFSTKATDWLLPKGRSATQELVELNGWRHTFHVEQSVTDPQSGIIMGKLLGPG